jgi:hypothetical protein
MINPYAPPSAPGPWVKAAESSDKSLLALAKRVFFAWEKLRVVYIALLVVETVALIGPLLLFDERIFFMVVEGAIVVNLFFFAGPVVETSIRWLGYERQWPRWAMFISGTGVTMAATSIAIFTDILPPK